MPDEHVITFDREMFLFKGCGDYLLTSDFLRDCFSIVGRYEDGEMTGLAVESGGKRVFIGQDGKVTVDGCQMALPPRSLPPESAERARPCWWRTTRA